MSLARSSPSSLQKRIDAYFTKALKNKSPITLSGLALHLKVTRQTLLDYKDTDVLGPIISQAKLRCENHLEEKLVMGAPPTGIVFILKNGYGWKDKVEIDQTINAKFSLSSLFDQAQLAKKGQGVIEGEVVQEVKQDKLPDSLF